VTVNPTDPPRDDSESVVPPASAAIPGDDNEPVPFKAGPPTRQRVDGPVGSLGSERLDKVRDELAALNECRRRAEEESDRVWVR
jgi:hypothetical protein